MKQIYYLPSVSRYISCFAYIFNLMTFPSSLTRVSHMVCSNRSVESDITFPRGSDAVNQRNIMACNFYRFARGSREHSESASYRIKQSGITREPRCIIEANAGDSVVQFASQRGQHRYSLEGKENRDREKVNDEPRVDSRKP